MNLKLSNSGLTELQIQFYDNKLRNYRCKLKRFLAIKENRKALNQRDHDSLRSEKEDFKILKLQNCLISISEDLEQINLKSKYELDNLLSYYRYSLGISTKEDNE